MVSLSAQSLKVLRQRIPLFEGFSDAELTYLMSKSTRRTLNDGERLINDGALSTRLFIVVSGEAHVIRRIGDTEHMIASLKPGATVGEMGVVDCAPRSARVISAGETTILELEQTLFEEASPEVVARLFKNIAGILAQRMRETISSVPTGLVADGVPEQPQSGPLSGIEGFDGAGGDFVNGQFAGANFSGGVFSDADFRGANFQGADLGEADLRGANLEGVVFDDDQMIGISAAAAAVTAAPMANDDLQVEELDSLAATLIGDNEDD